MGFTKKSKVDNPSPIVSAALEASGSGGGDNSNDNNNNNNES